MSALDAKADHELLDQFVRGDPAAFHALVRRHEDRVFAICLGVTRNRSDALDAAQETFLSVYRRAATFRGTSAFTTWLYQVAVNASRDLLRKRSRHETAEAPVEDRAAAGPAVEDHVVRRLDISAALEQVPEQYREAVVMHDLAGLPYEEIAELTGVPDGTVKSRISRGRRHLARLLEPHSRHGRQTEVSDPHEGMS